MAQPAGEAESDAMRLDFDCRLQLEFYGFSVTSDAGLLACRELDDALSLMGIAGQPLVDSGTDKNGRHDFVGMLRQAMLGRLAGYKEVNDADRLGRDPAMRRHRRRQGNRARRGLDQPDRAVQDRGSRH
ncbi:MAG: transposase [Reyranella sp.]|nr:transposase [Reyranella sp.]